MIPHDETLRIEALTMRLLESGERVNHVVAAVGHERDGAVKTEEKHPTRVDGGIPLAACCILLVEWYTGIA